MIRQCSPENVFQSWRFPMRYMDATDLEKTVGRAEHELHASQS
jgi:hypothetical protein